MSKPIPADYAVKRKLRERLTDIERIKAYTEEAKAIEFMIVTAEQLRKAAIRRWIIEGFPNFKIAEAFNLTASRISQIKKEIENE